MESTLVHLSGHQFATDPNPDHNPNPNRACNPYKYYTLVSTKLHSSQPLPPIIELAMALYHYNW